MGPFHYARPTCQRPVELTKVKMERHCSIDTKLTTGPKRSIYVSTEVWTTFSGKFPSGPKRSIYVSTEISGNFGIMESTHI